MKIEVRQPAPPIPARVWKIAAVAGTGAFMAMLDATVANLALESIRADFDTTLTLVQWVATGYLIALAVSLPATGWLGSRFGYGRVWMAALGLFVVASALCGLAPGPLTLIAARFLKGLSAGMMVPSGQAIIGSTANPKQLGRLMGILGLVISLGPAVGPAVGGFVLEIASWRWLFWINVPIGLAALWAARGLLPAGPTDQLRQLDRLGLALLAIGLPLLLFGATEIGSLDESDMTAATERSITIPLTCVVLGAIMVLGFIRHALHVPAALINLRLLQRGVFSASTMTCGFTGANMYGGLLLLPLYLQLMRGFDQGQAGVLLLAMGLGSAIALPVAGFLTDRIGAGPVAFTGATFLTVSTIPFLFAQQPGNIWLTILLIVRGAGMALTQMPAMTSAYSAVTPAEMGDASTLLNIIQRVGGSLGAIMVVILLAQLGGRTSVTGYHWAFLLILVLSVLALITTTVLRRHTKKVNT